MTHKKYEITDIAHPKYPWLHRIRALKDYPHIKAGAVGGYVEKEENLSQEGYCWIYDNAICCEDGLVSGDSVLKDQCVVRESGSVLQNSHIAGNAMIRENGMVVGSYILDNAIVAGHGSVSSSEDFSPYITGNAIVYGKVCGTIRLEGNYVCLPGQEITSYSKDLITISDKGIDIKFSDKPLSNPSHSKRQPER